MDGESSKRNVSKGTPIKALKRDVRGLLSLQQESPSQSDVLWNSLDSPIKSHRAVGGKSKSLKSSNQLTPKNHAIRKKYYSSPILVARIEDNNKDDMTNHKNIENQRILEEFQRQFSNDNYVPRNLMENLTDNLDDSIIIPDAQLAEQKSDSSSKLTDYDFQLTDQEDFEVLAEIEEEARRFLEEKLKDECKEQSPTKVSSSTTNVQTPKPNAPTSNNVKNSVPASTTSKIEKKVTKKNVYFDSDDDDIILSIPIEKLSAESSHLNTLSNRNKNVKDQPMKNNNDVRHTSVIPTKREHVNVSFDKNRMQNQSNSKPFAQPKSDTVSATLQEPLAKRRCTSQEIAEKRRQAMLRREAYLQSLKTTQK